MYGQLSLDKMLTLQVGSSEAATFADPLTCRHPLDTWALICVQEKRKKGGGGRAQLQPSFPPPPFLSSNQYRSCLRRFRVGFSFCETHSLSPSLYYTVCVIPSVLIFCKSFLTFYFSCWADTAVSAQPNWQPYLLKENMWMSD